MIGLVIALFSGFSHCLSSIFVRQGVYRSGESFSPIPISNFAGLVFFTLAIIVSGNAKNLVSISWLGVAYLAGAGVLHFVIGRFLAYTGIRLIGANRSNPIVTSNILVSASLGILFLGEPLTIYLILALVLVFGGIILISRTGNSGTKQPGMPEGSRVRGVLTTLGAALCWGISPALVKVGLQEVNSPILATFISYAAASIVVGILLLHPDNNDKLRHLERPSLIPIVIAAVFNATAHLLRYIALAHSPVSLVAPLINSINGLLVFPLSFLINRKIETFNLRIILGAIAVIGGVLFIFLAA
jgi:drug/metabolite transporter (DMT)-like permease